MKIKTTLLCLATGFSTGIVSASGLCQLRVRTVSLGGEIFFVPMVVLLIWLGWMLKSEQKHLGKVKRIDKSKKQG